MSVQVYKLFNKSCVLLTAIMIVAITLSGCNVLSSMDHPSSDAQYLSAARACFDKADYQCAAANYGKLSSSLAETGAAEATFLTLDQNGASMASFMEAFGSGVSDPNMVGKCMSKLGELMYASGGASATKRAAIFGAFTNVNQITTPELRGLIRFLSASALFAELLAENINTTTGRFTGNNLVQDSVNCLKESTTDPTKSCITDAILHHYCQPAGTWALGTSISLSNTATHVADTTQASAVASGGPTLFLLNAAMSEVVYSLTQEMVGKGNLGGSTSGFSTTLTQTYGGYLIAGSQGCYLFGLLSLGIGAN